MITGNDLFRFDDRVFNDTGVVYDLGCYRWDWCQPFLGRKLVVGVDPNESQSPDGAILVPAVVAPFAGQCIMHGKGLAAALADPTMPYIPDMAYSPGRPEREPSAVYTVPAITWPQLVSIHGPAALVKMNIEGAEIPLLFSVKQPMAPQLVISFHWAEMEGGQPNFPPLDATDACLRYLEKWYKITETSRPGEGKSAYWYMMVIQ